jgi:hypothetical protein
MEDPQPAHAPPPPIGRPTQGESSCDFFECALGGEDRTITGDYCCQNRCRANANEYGSLQSAFFKDYRDRCRGEINNIYNKLAEVNRRIAEATDKDERLLRDRDICMNDIKNKNDTLAKADRRIAEAEGEDERALRELMQIPSGAFLERYGSSIANVIDVVEHENKDDVYYYKIIITDAQNRRQYIIWMSLSNLNEFIKKIKPEYKNFEYDISDDAAAAANPDQIKDQIQTFFDKLLEWAIGNYSETTHIDEEARDGISGLLNSSPFNELYSKYNYKKYIEISGGSKMKTKKRKYKTKKRKYNTKKKKYNTKKRKYKTKKRKYNT